MSGQERTGTATPQTQSALQAATLPPPLVPNGAANRVEIDLTRQVLFLYEGGKLERIVSISSGTMLTIT